MKTKVSWLVAVGGSLFLLASLIVVNLLSGCATKRAAKAVTPLPASNEAVPREALAHPAFTPEPSKGAPIATTTPPGGRLWRSYGGYGGGRRQPELLAQAVPTPAEELWVIARGSEPVAQAAEDALGSGALMAKVEKKEVPMPLKHTDVRAFIS